MSYSGIASGVASKLIALQKLADSRVEDFPSKSFWLPFDDDWWRWCPLMSNSTRDARHSSLSKIFAVDSTDLPGQDQLVVPVTLGKRQSPNNQLQHTDSN